jgi:hypothetical protein
MHPAPEKKRIRTLPADRQIASPSEIVLQHHSSRGYPQSNRMSVRRSTHRVAVLRRPMTADDLQESSTNPQAHQRFSPSLLVCAFPSQYTTPWLFSMHREPCPPAAPAHQTTGNNTVREHGPETEDPTPGLHPSRHLHMLQTRLATGTRSSAGEPEQHQGWRRTEQGYGAAERETHICSFPAQKSR